MKTGQAYLLLLLFLFPTCSESEISPLQDHTLEGVWKWRSVVNRAGKTTFEDEIVVVEFSKGHINGRSPHNILTGTYSLDKPRRTVTIQLEGTEIAEPEWAESWMSMFRGKINGTLEVKRDGEELNLENDDWQLIFMLVAE